MNNLNKKFLSIACLLKILLKAVQKYSFKEFYDKVIKNKRIKSEVKKFLKTTPLSVINNK